MTVKEEQVAEPEKQMSIVVAFGWLINIVAWILFIFTDSNSLEIAMGVACLFALVIGFFKSSNKLIKASLFDAAWMFAWGFNIIGF